jgi:hypothetical protein
MCADWISHSVLSTTCICTSCAGEFVHDIEMGTAQILPGSCCPSCMRLLLLLLPKEGASASSDFDGTDGTDSTNELVTTKLVQNNYESDPSTHFQNGRFECVSCSKRFSTQSNLNRHMRTSIICEKWKAHMPPKAPAHHLSPQKEAYNANCLTEPHSINDYYKPNEDSTVSFDTIRYTIHDPPKDNLIHVIWNLFICDKYQKIDQDVIDRNGIGYIITILPYESDYLTYIPDELTTGNPTLSWEAKEAADKTLPHHTIEYLDTHEDTIDAALLATYQDQCARIEEVRKQPNRNIIIFCNNGYQRSVPFLCYYLLKYHPDEYPSLINVLQLVLGKVQGKPEPDYMNEYIKLLPKLCELFKSATDTTHLP